MIKLINGYFADADSQQFILCTISDKLDKKDKPIKNNVGYFTTLSALLKSLHTRLIREKVKLTDLDLNECMAFMDEIATRLENIPNLEELQK